MDSQAETDLPLLYRLGPDQGKKLKDIATTSLKSYASGMKYRPRIRDRTLKEKSGLYVTLRSGNEVRGNSGFIYPTYELWNATRMSAVNAAFMDPRFKPVEKREIEYLDIEISIIGQVEKIRTNSIKDLSAVGIGTDGIMVVGTNASSVMLPQVAVEMKLEPLQFIEAACESAGLPENAWSERNVAVYRFPTKIF